MRYEIKQLDTATEQTWDAYVEKTHRSVYHLSQWRHIIHDEFGHDALYLYALDTAGSIVGVLPLIRQKSRLFGDNLISIPYFNYGGPAGDNVEIEQLLIAAAAEHADAMGIRSIEFRDICKRDELAETRDSKITMLLDLPNEEEVLWKALGAKRRSQIKRPLRENVEALYGGQELLKDFYAVFTRNMRDLGTPVYPLSFFERIVEAFPDRVMIHVIKLDGQSVGGAFVISHQQVAEIPWASTLRESNRLGINMYMYWEVIRKAIADGNQRFDFGRSTKDSGTYRFKKQWGAEPVQLYWNYWLAEGEHMPALNPDNPKYRLAIKTWQKMPLFLTNWIGPKIVGNLP